MELDLGHEHDLERELEGVALAAEHDLELGLEQK